jgi:hypothetical protein
VLLAAQGRRYGSSNVQLLARLLGQHPAGDPDAQRPRLRLSVFRAGDAQDPAKIKSGSFINTDHWMVDLVDVSPFNLSGGILVSPDRASDLPTEH